MNSYFKAFALQNKGRDATPITAAPEWLKMAI